MQVLHLASRFFGSLSSKRPVPADVEWLFGFLGSGEQDLWHRMPPADQRHAIAVARRVEERLAERDLSDEKFHPIMAAAALHDVGKIASGFGTFQRVGATVIWKLLPDRWAASWVKPSGPRGRLAAYHLHPDLGAKMLADAGADPFTVSWASQHHRSEKHWTGDRATCRVLKECDDD